MAIIVKGGGGKSSGLYVWKKWKIESKQVTLSFSVLNSSSPYQLKVDCDNEVALKIESASSFVGLHGIWNGNGYYEFPDANTFRIYDGGNIYNFTSVYDATTNTFSVTSSTGIGNTSQFADCTHTMQAGTFEGFVVSDSESAYPDGGTQDGYWYKKVVEGVDLMTMLGCTKMTIDKITFATEQYDGTQIPHSHGYAPKYIIMTTSSIPDTPYTLKDEFLVNDKRIGAWHTTGSDGQVYPENSITTEVIVNDSYFKIGTTTSKPSYSSYLRYGIGIEYNIICFS